MPKAISNLRSIAYWAVLAPVLAAVSGTGLANDRAGLQPAAVPDTELIFPGVLPSPLTSWVQLVWNPTEERLARRGYTAWTPFGSVDLDAQWAPEDIRSDQAGLLNGRGTLTFRHAGSGVYEADAVVAQYTGTMRNGLPHGEGALLLASGYSYSGAWQLGLMHGQGRLLLPNGDEYVGDFVDGRREGHGRYVDATGTIYDGGFKGDRREGDGHVQLASGASYEAHWAAGQVLTASQRWTTPAGVAVLDAKAGEELAISVRLEQRPLAPATEIVPMAYASRSVGSTLEIFPGDDRLMGVWKGSQSIALTDAELADYFDIDTISSFLGAEQRYTNISLVIGVDNTTGANLAIVGGYVEVGRSVPEREPAIHFVDGASDERCSADDPLSDTTLLFENYGWSGARNTVLRYSFGAGGNSLKHSIGTIAGQEFVDISKDLDGLGVASKSLRSEALQCSSAVSSQSCLAEVRATKKFGKLANVLKMQGNEVVAEISGTLEYSWVDGSRANHHRSSPFQSAITLGIVDTDSAPECGEGGDIMDIKGGALMLKGEGKNYRKSLPVTADVGAGRESQWRLVVGASEASSHEFRIVFQLADGRTIASRPMKLLYFKPKPIPAEERYFGPEEG